MNKKEACIKYQEGKKLKIKREKQLGRLFLSCVSFIFIFRTGTEKNAWENFCVVV